MGHGTILERIIGSHRNHGERMTNEPNEPQRQRLSTVEALNQAADHVGEAAKVLLSCPTPDSTLTLESRAFEAVIAAHNNLRDALRACLRESERVGKPLIGDTKGLK
jgi:hypothetical protein